MLDLDDRTFFAGRDEEAFERSLDRLFFGGGEGGDDTP